MGGSEVAVGSAGANEVQAERSNTVNRMHRLRGVIVRIFDFPFVRQNGIEATMIAIAHEYKPLYLSLILNFEKMDTIP